MATVTNYEVRDLGEDGSQYFPWDSVAFSHWTHCEVGVGDTAREALEDALESMAQSDHEVSDEQAADMLAQLSNPDKSALGSCHEFNGTRDADGNLGHPENEDCECDWNHYVSIRYDVALPEVPKDYPVRPLGPNDAAKDRATCGTCGRSWDDAIVTSMTPAPSARCPFEAFHE